MNQKKKGWMKKIIITLFCIMTWTQLTTIAEAAYAMFNDDAQTQYACTYIAWTTVKEQLGIELPLNWGDAKAWYQNAAAAGFEVHARGTVTPQVGWLVTWNDSAWGHVAYITEVNSSTGQIKIHEGGSAWPGNDKGVCDRYTSYTTGIQGFINPGIPNRTQVSVEAGDYIVQTIVGERVLDIDSASIENGANAQIYAPNDANSQVFHIEWNNTTKGYAISLKESGKFLDTEANTNGQANVFQWEGTGANGQNWIFEDAKDGYVYIRNLWGYYLDVMGAEDKNGQNVQVHPFNGSPAQRWRLVKVSGNHILNQKIEPGKYIFLSKTGKKVLDIAGGSKEYGANAQIYEGNAGASQVFEIGHNKEIGANFIKLVASNLLLDSEANKNGQTNVFQWEATGAKGQNWIIEDAGDGEIYIRNLWGYYLDVMGAEDKNGQNVQVHPFNGSTAQRWSLIPYKPCMYGHVGTPVLKDVKEATCIKTGYTGDKYCPTCGQIIQKGMPAITIVHNAKKHEATPATETKEGNIEYYECMECHKYFSDFRCTRAIVKDSWIIPKLSAGNTQNDTSDKDGTNNSSDKNNANTPESSGDKIVKTGRVVDTKSHAVYNYTCTSKGVCEAVYVKPENKNSVTIEIPSSIKIDNKTYAVTSISKNTFKKNKKVRKIVIGKNVTKIGKDAFADCKNLKQIIIKTKKLKKGNVSTKAFRNVKKSVKIKVPKGKLKAYKKFINHKNMSE